MKILTANPVLIDGNRADSRDMYLSLDASSSKSEIKAFQDWLDSKGLKWVKATDKDLTNGSKLNKGKGYGNFGPSTTKAYARYGKEWDSLATSKPTQTGGTGTQAYSENTKPTSTTPSEQTDVVLAPEEPSTKKSFVEKFKSLSTTKKVLYIAIPVVLIVGVVMLVRKNK